MDPGGQRGFAKLPLIPLSNSLVRLEFSFKYGEIFRNVMQCRSWHTICSVTIYSDKSRRLAHVAVSNFIFLNEEQKFESGRKGRFS
jgi:hypothetical protein